MRVDGEHHVFNRGLEFQRGHRFRDQLRGNRADDMYAQNLTVLCVRHNFDKALMVIDNGGFGVGGERELADFDLMSGFFGFDFCQAHTADLWLTVSTAGNMIFVDSLRRLASYARY